MHPLIVVLAACSWPGMAPTPGPAPVRVGNASWYGPDFDGKATASGEIYDASGRSAAHRTLPFGTVLEVRVIETGAVARVRVNDRGPFVDDRFLDLSQGTAKHLAILDLGIVEVEVRVVECPDEAWSECVL